jgi:hypothetical protein
MHLRRAAPLARAVEAQTDRLWRAVGRFQRTARLRRNEGTPFGRGLFTWWRLGLTAARRGVEGGPAAGTRLGPGAAFLIS